MICSICKKGETSVVDSRPTEDGTAIRRRRLCVCGARFTTFERVQYREIMVVKKNGRKSTFDREKLAKSVSDLTKTLGTSAKGDKDVVNMVTNKVIKVADKVGDEGNITNNDALNKAAEEMALQVDKINKDRKDKNPKK